MLIKTTRPVSAKTTGVAGMGINQASNRLPYDMILLLKKFLVTLKKGEQMVEN